MPKRMIQFQENAWIDGRADPMSKDHSVGPKFAIHSLLKVH